MHLRHLILLANRLLLLLVLILMSSACSENDPVEIIELEEEPLFSHAMFPIGVAVGDLDLLKNDAYFRSISIHHFNSVTAGNDMKMDALHPQQGSYSWSNADYIVDFCKQYDKRLHGHVLVWHSQVPSWMESYEGSSDAWEAMLKDHVQTVVAHFRDLVPSWDVVNEAFEDNGTLRHTIWRDNIGDDYMAKCFQWAHEADPDAILYYNDYGIPYHDSKLRAVLDMIDDFQHRDPPIPIHGIGLQMHIHHDIPFREAIQATVDSIRARGLMVHFSELDIQMNQNQVYSEFNDALDLLQAERYREVVEVYCSLPASLRDGITIWGVSDADTWIRYFFNRLDWPLLFDEQYQPKAAFYSTSDALSDCER